MGAIRRTSVSTCAGFAEPTHSAQSRSRSPVIRSHQRTRPDRAPSICVMAICVIWPRCRPRCGPRPVPGRNCRRSFGARWSTTTARSRPARSSSIRRTPISISCSARKGAPLRDWRRPRGLHLVRRGRKCPGRRNGPIGIPPGADVIERQPYLPRFMAGGDGNPHGARALYLGDTIYRIHGTNQPSTIGTFVSSGCIRLTNEDITDLHARVKVGTRVVVLPGRGQATAVTTGLGSSAATASRDKPPGVPSSSDLPARRFHPRRSPKLPRQPASASRRACPCRCDLSGRYISGDLSSLASGARGTKTSRRNAGRRLLKTRPSASWKARPARFASLRPLRPRAIRTPPDSRSRATGRSRREPDRLGLSPRCGRTA